jgi:hypothetical protein
MHLHRKSNGENEISQNFNKKYNYYEAILFPRLILRNWSLRERFTQPKDQVIPSNSKHNQS